MSIYYDVSMPIFGMSPTNYLMVLEKRYTEFVMGLCFLGVYLEFMPNHLCNSLILI